MPSKTIEQIQQGEEAAKKALAALGADADPNVKRAAAKKLRRAQRIRRRMLIEIERQKPKGSSEAAE